MSSDGNIHDIMSSGNKRPGIITPHDGGLPKRRIEYAMADTTPSALGTWSPDDDEDTNLRDELNEQANEQETTAETETENDNVLLLDEDALFIVSPLGLCCRRPNCTRPQIIATDRSIRDHLRSHKITFTHDLVQNFLKRVEDEARNARLMQSMEPYRMDDHTYTCFTCACGRQFTNKRSNAVAHCNNSTTKICDAVNIKTATAIKLRCGRFVTQSISRLQRQSSFDADGLLRQLKWTHL